MGRSITTQTDNLFQETAKQLFSQTYFFVVHPLLLRKIIPRKIYFLLVDHKKVIFPESSCTVGHL